MKDGSGVHPAGMREPCPAGCCPHGTTPGCPPDLPDAPESERMAHLYACQLLSTYQIARITGDNRQRVNWLLRKAGVPVNPRGTGRPRAGRDDQARHIDDLMTDMYLRLRLSTTQIAEVFHIPASAVRYRLLGRGVPMRTRGGNSREDRIVIPQDELADLYLQSGLSADEVGQMLGVSRRVVLRSAHDAGLPVRVGGAPPQRGPPEIELIQALYADTMVSAVLTRHGVPEVPEAGPIWQRFPVPHKLTAELAAELYWDCGLGLHHIELLTGQPAGTVSNLLRARGVPLRSAGGRSPFMRRWREGNGLRIVRDCPPAAPRPMASTMSWALHRRRDGARVTATHCHPDTGPATRIQIVCPSDDALTRRP
jgi:hypothetical protein